MIRINLLPYEMRPIKRTPLPYIVAISLLLVVLVYCMLIFFSLFAEINRRHSNIDAKKSELDSLAATVEEFEKLTLQKQQLSVKIATIQEIIADRVVWSKQLEALAVLTPQNIWYTRIRLIWKMDQIWVEKVDNRTGKIVLDKEGQPVRVKTSVRTPFLEVSGYVATDPETGERDINPLTESLKSDPEFALRYELRNTNLEDVEMAEFGKLRKFTLEYVIANQ